MHTDLPFVHLRALEPEDLNFLYGIENDPGLWNVGTTNVPYSRYALYRYITDGQNDIYADRQVRLIIEDERKDKVGMIDLTDFEPKYFRAELGIVIKDESRNMGYASSAIHKIQQYASEILHLHQLYAYVGTNNEASLKLFDKSGFQKAGLLKEWVLEGHAYQDVWLMQYLL